jgi:enoyl-CoA hydratase/carnithine racemase
MEFFKVQKSDSGVTEVIFDRPPVNALSYATYREIRELSLSLRADDQTRVVIVSAPAEARAWCGGADLNDFIPLDYKTRMERYELVNECLTEFYEIDRPIIAAINGPVVGVGIVLATFSDIRIASEASFFASPEIDRGILAGGGAFYSRVGVPQGTIRELIYTGRRFTAQEMLSVGFLNYVVPGPEVLPKAREVASLIAQKSLPALKANKIANNAAESLAWRDAYKLTNPMSAELTVGADAKEGIKAFLEGRSANYLDR